MTGSSDAWLAVQSPVAPSLPEALDERDTLQTLLTNNGAWLVTRHPGRVRVWDRATMAERAAFLVATDTTGIALSPDDRFLAKGGGDGDLQIRTIPGGDEIAVLPHDGPVTKNDVRRRLDRDLTDNEWTMYVGNETYAETRASASTRLRAPQHSATQRPCVLLPRCRKPFDVPAFSATWRSIVLTFVSLTRVPC
jgi:hypothetical protein